MRKTIFLLPCLFLLTACPLDDDNKKISELENKIALLEERPTVQRYQLVIAPQFPGRFRYLVDTQKGKIWSPKQFSDIGGQPEGWTEEDIIDNSGEIGMTWDKYLQYRAIVDRETKTGKK